MQQPLLLIEDVGGAMEELRRLMPGSDPLLTLKYNPHILVSGERSRARLLNLIEKFMLGDCEIMHLDAAMLKGAQWCTRSDEQQEAQLVVSTRCGGCWGRQC